MVDIEKVIKALENCKEGGSCDGCEYDIQSSKCIFMIHADALELLKEYQQLQGWATGHGIVLCKDCKHYENSGWFTQCFRHNGISPDVDWFCADGERK